MFGSAVIVFREVVEAALVVSIVMAAARAAPGRNGWVGIGIVVGLAGASLVAAFAASIAGFAAGIGQELLNAAILFVAVAMLACHNVWMARHGRELAARVNAVGHAVASGARPLYALAIVIAAAVLREGSETVLFVYGIAIGGGDGLGTLIAGCLIGLASGIALGATLYFGLLAHPVGTAFRRHQRLDLTVGRWNGRSSGGAPRASRGFADLGRCGLGHIRRPQRTQRLSVR